MTTWGELCKFIRSNYTITADGEAVIRLLFSLPGGRRQGVQVGRAGALDGFEEWAIIESPFAWIDQVDIKAVIREISDSICGGVASLGDCVTFRYSIPLRNLDTDDFVRALQLVTLKADQLEAQFSGGGDYF